MDRVPAPTKETTTEAPAKLVTRKLTSFIETTPLYVKLKIRIPPVFESVRPEVVELYCSNCKQSRPFRGEPQVPYFPEASTILCKRSSIVFWLAAFCLDCQQQ